MFIPPDLVGKWHRSLRQLPYSGSKEKSELLILMEGGSLLSTTLLATEIAYVFLN